MAKEAAVVGVDLGGTNLRLALVSAHGEIQARWERATPAGSDRDALIETLARDLAACGEKAGSLGVADPGGRPGHPRPDSFPARVHRLFPNLRS